MQLPQKLLLWGEIKPTRLEPVAKGLRVIIAAGWRDDTEQRVLEHEIERLIRLVAQKIADAVIDREPPFVSQALGKGDGAWGDVEPGHRPAGLGQGAGVVTAAAAGDERLAGRERRVRG